MTSIYVADLTAYNNGELRGQWLAVTSYDDENGLLEEIHDKILKHSPYGEVELPDTHCLACDHEFNREGKEHQTCPKCGSKMTMYVTKGQTAEEWAIHGYDGFGTFTARLGEYPDLDEVCTLAGLLEKYDEKLLAHADEYVSDWSELQDYMNDAYRGEWSSEEDFAWQFLDDIGAFKEMGEMGERYFDINSFTNDLFINDLTSVELENGNIAVFDNHY